MISLEIFTWFDSSIVKQSKLIYAMPWIFSNDWFERQLLHRVKFLAKTDITHISLKNICYKRKWNCI